METPIFSPNVVGRAAASRRTSPVSLLRCVAVVLLLLLLSPLLAVVGMALFGEGNSSFLSVAVLLKYAWHTLLYVGGVVVLSLFLALPAAWATIMLAFPGRRLAVWMLFLPFALPPYLSGYTAADMLGALGVNPPGMLLAIVATALAIYPYIFFMARMALRQQHCHIQSAARLLGCSPLAAFRRVSLPLARPAIGVGVALVVMETLNDIAVAEYFGVHTLGAGIYDLWLNRDDIVGATRLALLLVAVVLVLVVLEETSRRRQVHYVAACDRCYECERAFAVKPMQQGWLWAALLLPAVLGFWLPMAWLFYLSVKTPVALWWQPFIEGLGGSMLLSFSLALLLLGGGLLLAWDKRRRPRGGLFKLLAQLSRVTYALPGTLLAQGIFVLAGVIAYVSGWQLLAVGGFAFLLLACSSRFLVIAGGNLESAMDTISPQLDKVAKLAAQKPWETFFTVHLPLLRPAIATAAVMIFLEGVKELPMTLILRPFNFNTLATTVYQYASDEALELAAPSALVLAGLAAAAISVLFLFEGRDTRGAK